MTLLPHLRFVEQLDLSDTSGSAQEFAYVADLCVDVRLSVNIDDVRGQGIANAQWHAMEDLRDKLCAFDDSNRREFPLPGLGWFVVHCGDEIRERGVPGVAAAVAGVAGAAPAPIRGGGRTGGAGVGAGGGDDEEKEDDDDDDGDGDGEEGDTVGGAVAGGDNDEGKGIHRTKKIAREVANSRMQASRQPRTSNSLPAVSPFQRALLACSRKGRLG